MGKLLLDKEQFDDLKTHIGSIIGTMNPDEFYDREKACQKVFSALPSDHVQVSFADIFFDFVAADMQSRDCFSKPVWDQCRSLKDFIVNQDEQVYQHFTEMIRGVNVNPQRFVEDLTEEEINSVETNMRNPTNLKNYPSFLLSTKNLREAILSGIEFQRRTNITPLQLADRIESIFTPAKRIRRLAQTAFDQKIPNVIEVGDFIVIYAGPIEKVTNLNNNYCPFTNMRVIRYRKSVSGEVTTCGLGEDKYIIKNKKTGKSIEDKHGLLIHFLSDHHFFGARVIGDKEFEGVYGINPDLVVEVLEIEAGENYYSALGRRADLPVKRFLRFVLFYRQRGKNICARKSRRGELL